MLKKINKYKFIILLFLIIIAFLNQNKFFNKVYILLTENYSERLDRVHGKCFQIGAGFLKRVSNEFEIKPKIFSYISIPSSYWLFDNAKTNARGINEKYIALLNYKENLEYHFTKSNDEFFVNLNRYDSNIIYTARELKIFSKIKKFPIDVKIFFEDFSQSKKYDNFKKIIKKVKSIQITKENSKIFKDYISYNLHKSNLDYGTRNKNIYIKIDQQNNITDVKLGLINKFDLDKFKILKQEENCYLLKND